MRILIDTSYAARAPRSGTGIYVRRVVAALRELGGVEVHEAVDEGRRAPAGGGLGSARNLARDLWWTNVELPRMARRAGAELIHHPLPAWSVLSRLPQVITVTDVAFELLPHAFDRGFRAYARIVHRWAARRAAQVICISETTAADVRRLWGVPADRISVALLGPGQELRGGPRQELQGTAAPPADAPHHFLYVGDGEPRKNLPVLLEAHARYRAQVGAAALPLVLAGSATARGPGVSVVERPDAARLAELYRAAAALVHPARHEGFGLTPLEAMRLGTPVLAARAAAVVEVCGEAARYADADDVEAFAAGLVELGGDPALRASLRERGLRRAAEFTWERCACAHLDAYSLALSR